MRRGMEKLLWQKINWIQCGGWNRKVIIWTSKNTENVDNKNEFSNVERDSMFKGDKYTKYL